MKNNNLRGVIRQKLESMGARLHEFDNPVHGDLIGYDHSGRYIAVKIGSENRYTETKEGARFIECSTYDQFTSLLINKKPLTQAKAPDLFN